MAYSDEMWYMSRGGHEYHPCGLANNKIGNYSEFCMGYSGETWYVGCGGHKYHPSGPLKGSPRCIFCKYSEGVSREILVLLLFYLQEYLETDPSGRDPDDVQVILVKQGHEPLNFAGNFPAWDWDHVSYSISLQMFHTSCQWGTLHISK